MSYEYSRTIEALIAKHICGWRPVQVGKYAFVLVDNANLPETERIILSKENHVSESLAWQDVPEWSSYPQTLLLIAAKHGVTRVQMEPLDNEGHHWRVTVSDASGDYSAESQDEYEWGTALMLALLKHAQINVEEYEHFPILP